MTVNKLEKRISENCRAVMFDFDGVLCYDHFYEATLADEYPDACIWIEKNIFTDRELLGKWMRGKLSSHDINVRIAAATKLDVAYLDRKLDESAGEMRLNKKMFLIAQKIKANGAKIGIISDNMDVFSRVIAPRNDMAGLFDIIVNSADYGLLKQDFDGALFDIAADKIGVPIAKTIFIDDSKGNTDLFARKGGESVLYA
jgi:FMN phosphatase YigB (HAD superfamily)